MYDFKLKLQELFRTIGECNNMVLSTSTNDKISSRMMSIIMIDGCFYFQTDKEFRKSKQISENPNVALCFENVSIEGQCSELGKPSKNDFLLICFKSIIIGHIINILLLKMRDYMLYDLFLFKGGFMKMKSHILSVMIF